MKKKSSILITVVCILLALVIVGWLNGRGNTQTESSTTLSNDPGQLTILPAGDQKEQTQPTAPQESDSPVQSEDSPAPDDAQTPALDETGKYNSKEEVALYIRTFGRLPSNYVTKETAREAGWEGGSLEKYCPGCSIGGDVFGNREGLLPDNGKRTSYECDIDTAGKNSRGAKRIVFSDDGLIYYTDDHYDSFEKLYGEED